ncbi:hypothetical protein BGX29_004947 [Mortierella sp. GBA35]|nr:hypothetical protein BGX29_004947 [Mortierella sp. GBA35]
MKVPTVLSTLVAAALAVTVHAAPTISSSFTPAPASTSLPSSGPSKNATLSREPQPSTVTDDAALFASLVKYNYKAAEEFVAHYNEAVYGNRTISRSNAAARASASTDVLPFCVGLAANPTRVRIFKNKMTCDISGWRTLFIFTAHTKQDVHQAPFPICTGMASNPNRSMLFSKRSSCSISGWDTDFSFYESGEKDYANPNPAISWLHQSTEMWQTWDPHRMMLYPYFDGKKYGWTHAYNLQYRSRYRLAADNEIYRLTIQQGNHEEVHKKLSVSSPPDSATARCALNLVQMWNYERLNKGNPTSIEGSSNADYVSGAGRDKCSHLVKSSVLRLQRAEKNFVCSVEAVIGGKAYAAISIPCNIGLPAHHVRTAFQESLRTGLPVMVGERADKSQDDSVVALIANTFVIIGTQQTYRLAIP